MKIFNFKKPFQLVVFSGAILFGCSSPDNEEATDPGIASWAETGRALGNLENEGDESSVFEIQNEANPTSQYGYIAAEAVNEDPVSGLQQRPTNLTCVAPDKPIVNTSVEITQVFAGVGTFAEPVSLVQAPNDTSQWYLVEQGGIIYRFDNDLSASGRELFIDISALIDPSYMESGLLGIAFHPDYQTNRYVYLSYTSTGPDATYVLTSRLSRFQSLDNGLTLDPSTEVILLNQDQRYTNHNGGHIAFGPDGFLYLGLGDSGSAGDPENRAQNTKNLFGTMMRIDVDAGSPYGIPGDNPFSGNPLCDVSTTGIDAVEACPEIFAWGLRNPWRWNFDKDSGVLWLADVGQLAFEEIDIIERGGNYGWRIQEGLACFNPTFGCDTSNLVQPIITYERAGGSSVTGGYVYRGTAIPELFGRYVFADYVMGKLFAATTQNDGSYGYEEIADTSLFISSLGQDEVGELYFLDYLGGTIRKITQFGGFSNNTIPDSLSGTGCMDSVDATRPAQGLIPYDTNVSFWSDGTDKERFYAIPDSLTVDVGIAGDWLFPAGTVLVKNFRLFGSLVETRLFMRHTNGEWAGYTYEWNSNETEATRVIGGKTRDISGQTWVFPSETQCMSCHTSIAGFSLGLEHLQLNKDFLYPGTGITANQLLTADAIDVLTDPLPDSPENLPSLAGMPAHGHILDFNTVSTNLYSDQQQTGSISVEEGGAALVLTDNTWRVTDQTFNISADTILEFDFESTAEGEVQAIGFDEDNAFENADRMFKLYGTQIWGIADFDTYSGGSRTHYHIPVGQYYTGNTMKLVFANDDDAGVGSNSRFSNIRIINCPNCLDFTAVSTSFYSNQQQTGFVSVEDAGATLVLTDNTWRVTDQVFNITADTILEFDYESTAEGEVQAIGFDEDNLFENADRMFKLYGTQTWGIADFDTYNGGGRTQYHIPVGQYYTGNAMKLVFANDDDAGVGSISRFSKVRVISCPTCLDFSAVSTSFYSNQRQTGTASVENAGATLMLTDNTWRVTNQTFNITPNTILEFDFESTAEGEVQAIGFDEDNLFENADRMFKLYGTQTWGIPDFNTYSGGGRTHYRIPVGQYYVGNAMNLVFANDDDAGAGSNGQFSNVRVISCPNCLDFSEVSTSLYSNQQQTGTVSVEGTGATLVLTDNTWRVTDQTFNITADTVLEFDFESTAEGEVQAIGFDEDNIFGSANRMFKLYGTQSWGIADFDTYDGDGTTHYKIPVGQYFTSNAMNLVFANDDDADIGSNSRFSNVQIRVPAPQGPGARSIQDQVRSYLHTNCAGCHRPFGPTPSNMDLRFDTTWPAMNVCDVIPTLGTHGIADARIIAPGASARSILVNRMSRRDAYSMPPVSSNLVDSAAIDLLTTWIDSLSACP